MKRTDRIEILQKEMEKHGIMAAFVTGGANRRYLTYAGIGSGCLLVMLDNAVFFTDPRYIDLAREKVVGCEVNCAEKPVEAAVGLLLQRGLKSCGLEYGAISVSEYRKLKKMLTGVELNPEDGVDGILAGMRRIKDDYEVSCLKQAQQIGDDAYLHMLEFIRPGMMESEVRMELGTYMVKLGSENFNMGFITSTGKKTAYPHGGSGDDQIIKGCFVMMDFGGMIDGYSADMTRTVAAGYADEQMRRVYDTVKKAQELGLSMIKPGITGQTVHLAVLDYIEQCGYPGCFTHGLGHSLGLEIHENPRCNAWDSSILKAGEMMTVEPGIYLEGKYGVRIEDMGIVTADGFDNFTVSTKELIIIGDLMMNKKERLEAFFNNEEMDHVPVGLWRHFPPEESHGQAYIDAQMKFYRETDQDFVKISCDGYFGFPNPVLENLEKPEDLFDIKPLGKDHPFIAEQVLRGADIVKALAGECMCFYTMFCPLSYLRLQVGWDKMMECIRANPKAVKFACDVIAEDVKALVKGLIEAGVDGVFYAVQNAEINRFTVEEYKNWVMPSDKKVLDYANALGKRNILHCCGWEDVRNNLEVWEDYESAAVNWAAYTEQLDVPHAKEFFHRPIWGGFDNKEKGILYKGTKKEIQEETKNLIRQGGKKGFMLGPDCSLPNGIDIEHIKWVVEAARDV